MKKQIFSGNAIYTISIDSDKIDISQILNEFNNNVEHYTFTHYINKRWENIYLNPQLIPSALPLLSIAISNALDLFRDTLEPHQTLLIPHELLGYNKNEFWFNTSTTGQSTRLHNHVQNAFLSGVFYLNVPDNSANIFFKSNDQTFELEVKTGEMIFFPSGLDHYVLENKSSETRISLAFNLYLFPISASVLHEMPT